MDQEQIEIQLNQFKTGFPFLKLEAAAAVGKGIVAPDEEVGSLRSVDRDEHIRDDSASAIYRTAFLRIIYSCSIHLHAVGRDHLTASISLEYVIVIILAVRLHVFKNLQLTLAYYFYLTFTYFVSTIKKSHIVINYPNDLRTFEHVLLICTC